MTPERMYELAYELGVAKNLQEVSAALTFMHNDIELTSPARGAITSGMKRSDRHA